MGDDSKLGKTFRGQTNAPIKTTEMVAAELAAQTPFANQPDAISIDVYFARRGHRDPVVQAAMRAFTKVRTAPVTAWDEIFAKF